MKTKAQKQVSLLETVAAVTGEFFFDNKGYRKFYDKHCDAISGIVGVWAAMVKASEVFEDVSPAYGEAGDDYDWLNSVIEYAKLLHSAEDLTTSEYRKLAIEALNNNCYIQRETPKEAKRGKK